MTRPRQYGNPERLPPHWEFRFQYSVDRAQGSFYNFIEIFREQLAHNSINAEELTSTKVLKGGAATSPQIGYTSKPGSTER